jgi:hypothetical protein
MPEIIFFFDLRFICIESYFCYDFDHVYELLGDIEYNNRGYFWILFDSK